MLKSVSVACGQLVSGATSDNALHEELHVWPGQVQLLGGAQQCLARQPVCCSQCLGTAQPDQATCHAVRQCLCWHIWHTGQKYSVAYLDVQVLSARARMAGNASTCLRNRTCNSSMNEAGSPAVSTPSLSTFRFHVCCLQVHPMAATPLQGTASGAHASLYADIRLGLEVCLSAHMFFLPCVFPRHYAYYDVQQDIVKSTFSHQHGLAAVVSWRGLP